MYKFIHSTCLRPHSRVYDRDAEREDIYYEQFHIPKHDQDRLWSRPIGILGTGTSQVWYPRPIDLWRRFHQEDGALRQGRRRSQEIWS